MSRFRGGGALSVSPSGCHLISGLRASLRLAASFRRCGGSLGGRQGEDIGNAPYSLVKNMLIKKQNTLEYEASPLIGVPHAFTTRLGGVSTGILQSLNIAFKEGECMEHVEENIRILAGALGFDEKKLILTRQTHSDIVRVVTSADHQSLCHRDYPECDALVTNDPGTALMVFTADCTPVLLWDSVTGAVGAAHAGWRGTAQRIAVKTARAMVERFGSRPEDIRAAIGPNIGLCHFETDADVPEAILRAYGEEARQWIETRGEKFHLDLKEINALGLRQLGISQIDVSGSCTACQPQRFWSHRVTRGQRGSQGAVIMCGEV